VLGPMSLKEQGDRRRPRIANLVQFAVTSNCCIATERLHRLTDSLTFVPAYTKSRSVGPLAVARLTQGISPKNCRLARARRAEEFGDMHDLHKPFVRFAALEPDFDNRPVSCRVQPSVVSLPKEMRNVLR
jgi:hypothetical protein